MLSVSLLTATQIILSLLLYAGVLLWALARVSWVDLVADSRRQHLQFGSVFVLFVLWLLRKEFERGRSLHFHGLSASALMVDWPLAVLAACGARLGMVALGLDDAGALGATGLLRILLRVLVTVAISRLLEHFRPT